MQESQCSWLSESEGLRLSLSAPSVGVIKGRVLSATGLWRVCVALKKHACGNKALPFHIHRRLLMMTQSVWAIDVFWTMWKKNVSMSGSNCDSLWLSFRWGAGKTSEVDAWMNARTCLIALNQHKHIFICTLSVGQQRIGLMVGWWCCWDYLPSNSHLLLLLCVCVCRCGSRAAASWCFTAICC